MIEPLDDELRALVGALQAVERPTAAARAATWAGIEARIAGDVVPLRRPRAVWALAAMAAAVALAVGLASAAAWRRLADSRVEAVHQAGAPTVQLIHEPDARGANSRASHPIDSRDRSMIDPPVLDPGPGDSPGIDPSIIGPVDSSSAESQVGAPVLDSGDLSRDFAHSQNAESTHDSPPNATRRRPRAPVVDSLRPEELASFQRAQAALAEGRPAEALRALDEHGRRFPGGLFEEERLVSRAAALCKLGRVAEARRARRDFLRARPASHLAERVRQICRDEIE